MEDKRDRSYRDRISEKIYYKDLGISTSILNKKNKEKSWEYKEYPEFNINFICISRDGTLGDIYKVENLYIGLPSSKDKEIINIDKDANNSFWKREEPPKEFNKLWVDYKRNIKKATGRKTVIIRENFISDRNALVDLHSEFVDNQFFKRKYGIFIKIDNEVHYLTGDNWIFLQYYYLTESNIYPHFRVTAMESYWHWEAVRADSRVWGEIRGKGRRTSWSVESASMVLNNFTLTKDAEIPVVSERKDLAGKLFTGKIVKSFGYYPIFFKPIIDLPNEEIKTNLQITFETDNAETSTIDFYPTKETAYDSLKVKNISINDEIGKWKNESLTEFIARHSHCHTEGNAKGRFGSTAGKYSDGGGKEFQDEFDDANATERNSLGRTENGLVSLFIDICFTMTQPISYFDKWGYSIVHDPKEPIKNENGKPIEFGAISHWNITYETLKKKDNKTKLNAFLRDMPRTVEHMFRNEGGVFNDFDIDNLNNHTDFLNDTPNHEFTERIFRGNLEWEGDEYTSNVIWKPNVDGKFKTTYLPNPDDQNKTRKINFHGKEWDIPANNHVGCFGVDSYDIIGTTKGGSDGTIVGYTKFNMTGAPSNSFVLIYKERPKKRDDFYDDVIMACKFFGFFALIESNKARLLEYMYDKGFTAYSMRRQDKKWKDLKTYEKEWGGIPSSTPVVSDQASLLKDYIVENVGQHLDDDCKVWHKELILEWAKFNLSKRQKFDLGVASGMAIMGSQYKIKQRTIVDFGGGGEGISLSDFNA